MQIKIKPRANNELCPENCEKSLSTMFLLIGAGPKEAIEKVHSNLPIVLVAAEREY